MVTYVSNPSYSGGGGRKIMVEGQPGQKKLTSQIQVPVAHAYNPSYEGGRDQEDHGLKPARANSL
jgi:hypothetical protein